MTRCSGSRHYHDVPPGFNVDDPRARVQVAGYPKHRGVGKWSELESDIDVFTALRTWLPDVGTYRILSNATSVDWSMLGLPVKPDFSAKAVSDGLDTYHDAGVRAVTAETDFNFGKFGLGYYLMAKKMWNPKLSAADLDAIRDEWLQRAFGSVWEAMKEYYDFMVSSTFPVNSTSSWWHAMDLIDAAEKELDPAAEPAVKRRIDDLKQYWYYYVLYDAWLKGDPPSPAPLDLRTFVWRGQMSYMNAMYVLLNKAFDKQTNPAIAAGKDKDGKDFAAGPAHYSPTETGTWWTQVRGHWPQAQPITRFEDATLADGTPAKDIDQNDLVLVDEFVWPEPYAPIFFNWTTTARRRSSHARTEPARPSGSCRGGSETH